MAQLPAGFVLDEELPKPKVSAGLPEGFVLDEPEVVQHAPGATGQAGPGPETGETGNPIGRKGDMRAGTQFRADPGTTFLEGALLGFGDEIVAGGAAPIMAVKNYFTGEGPQGLGENYDQALATQRTKLEATRQQAPGMALATELGGALATAKVPLGAISKAKSLGGAAVRSAGVGSAYGGIAGFGQGEGGLEERGENAKTSALIGGAVGGVAPYVGAGLSKLMSPFKVSSERQALVDALKRVGVDVTAGQRTGNHALRYAESELGGQKAAEMLERQGEQFTSAALKKAGIKADRATPDVIDDAYNRIGQEFDGLASRNMLEPDQKLVTDLQTVVGEYASLVPESQRAPIVQKVYDDIIKTVSMNGPNGTNAVQGASYQSLRSMLDRSARATKEPQLAEALRGIKNTLDDAMERSIGKNNPADAGAWREVRNQYRNMLVLEKAATGAGENAAMGIISPSHLRNAAVTQSRRGYARGKGDFAELARAGEAVMKPLPNSGTAGRTAVRALSAGIPAAIGSGLGGSAAGIPGALIGAAAGTALPKLIGALMMSKAGQKLIANQAAASPKFRDLVSALMVSGSAGRLPAP